MNKKNLANIVLFILVVIILIPSCKKDETEKIEAISIELVLGNNQIGETESTLVSPIEILIKDKNGNAFEGATVNFIITEGNVSETTTSTYANGKASVTWTLGSNTGNQTLTIIAFKTDGITHLTGSPITVSATATNPTTFTDPRDSHIYKIVTIGTQTWFAENLSYDTGDGCWVYDNNETNVTTCGRLYTYEAALSACPDGWHLPKENEWQTLISYLGGENVASGKLKAEGLNFWNSPNIGATNESGFTALPCGCRNAYGSFVNINNFGYWWSAPDGLEPLRYVCLSYNSTKIIRSLSNGENSIRCIKD